MRDTNAAHRAAQARVAPHAVNLGMPWDAADVDVLAGFRSDRAEDLALALGRTVYGVNAARQALREGRLGGGLERRPARQERLWTFLGSDVPPGW